MIGSNIVMYLINVSVPCSVFIGNQLNVGQIDKTFSKTGFTNWYNSLDSFKNQLSKSHMNSVNSMKNCLNEAVLSIDQLLDKGRKVILAK